MISEGTAGIRLTTLAGKPCTVTFEPWGTELVLMSGDVVYVESIAFATGDVEVSYDLGGIVLGFGIDASIVVVDGGGRRLSI